MCIKKFSNFPGRIFPPTFLRIEGWSRWDEIVLTMPEAELHGLEAELRSLSQGMARYEARFDHLAEVAHKLAGEVIQRMTEPA